MILALESASNLAEICVNLTLSVNHDLISASLAKKTSVLANNPPDFLPRFVQLMTVATAPKVCPGPAKGTHIDLIFFGNCEIIHPAFAVITPHVGLACFYPISDSTLNVAKGVSWKLYNLTILDACVLKP
jgi:hypothetical protein